MVEAVGEGVDRTLIGERVWIWEAAWQRPWGTAAEYTVVPVAAGGAARPDAVLRPRRRLGIPFLTAHRCLTVGESCPTGCTPGALSGHTVLVQGGAGAVGNAAIQLARWADATVHHHREQPGEGAARGGGRRPPRHQLPRAGRRRGGPQDRARRGATRSSRSPPPRNAAVDVAVARAAAGRSRVRRRRRRRGDPADPAADGAERALAVRAGLHRAEGGQGAGGRGRARRRRRTALRVGEEAGLPLHRFPLAEAAAAHQAVEDAVVGQGADHHQRTSEGSERRISPTAGQRRTSFATMTVRVSPHGTGGPGAVRTPGPPLGRDVQEYVPYPIRRRSPKTLRRGQLPYTPARRRRTARGPPSCRTCRRWSSGTASMNAQRSGSCHRATVLGEELAQLLGGRPTRPRGPRRWPAGARPTARRARRPRTPRATAGWAIRAFSSSTEEIHSPPDLMTSLARSVRVR